MYVSESVSRTLLEDGKSAAFTLQMQPISDEELSERLLFSERVVLSGGLLCECSRAPGSDEFLLKGRKVRRA